MSNAPGNTIEDVIIDRLKEENRLLRENLELTRRLTEERRKVVLNDTEA